MSLHRLAARQFVPISLDEAWAFFSAPDDLAVMTPPSLNMQVTSHPPDEMYPGLIVTYTMSPLPVGPFRTEWVTEITHVQPKRFFVDEQRLGPYRFWHHQHHFREVDGGTEVRDVVHYSLPFGPLGDIAHRFVVRPRLRAIFRYRRQVLVERFGSVSGDAG